MYNLYVKGSEVRQISIMEKGRALEQIKQGRVITLTRAAGDCIGRNIENDMYRALIPVVNMQSMEIEYLGIK